MKKKATKRIIPILKYNVRSFNEYQVLCDSTDTKKIVYKGLIDAIEDSIKRNKKEASIFMIDVDHYVSLNNKNWKSALINAIDFYSSEEIENYEMCQKCVDLINSIDRKTLQIVENE
jgi:sRNA-binding regulator protein Hfq